LGKECWGKGGGGISDGEKGPLCILHSVVATTSFLITAANATIEYE
jgi:hypothetical protein